MRDWLRRRFSRPSEAPQTDNEQPAPESQHKAAAWVAARDAGLLWPPADVHNASAWDEYWTNQLKVGTLEQGFSDFMSSDSRLPLLLASRGSRTILCVGNGLSAEAWSLALHGFDVTVLDISTVPRARFLAMARDAQHPFRRVPGFSLGEDEAVTFGAPGPIDQELCPAIHRSADYLPWGGGRLTFIAGDLIDPAICPGPFDVVVERRTLQLFPETEQELALDRLVARLSTPGVLVSHEHRGRWQPDMLYAHHAESALLSRGFVMASCSDADFNREADWLACLWFSTG